MTHQKKIKKGDEFWCLHPRVLRDVGEPLRGVVVSTTADKTKMVGLEFDKVISSFHNCDKRGKDGQCLWVRPVDMLTDEEFESYKKTMGSALPPEEVEELDLS